jgi:hypothetical protein
MAVVFPKAGNAFWPLPPDYPELDAEGQKAARVNAVRLRGRPDLEVASWAFFRDYYLLPRPKGEFYKHGRVRSPDMHYGWIYFWEKHQLSVTAAPRAAAKSTLIKENILRKIVSRPYWETVLFLAKMDFLTPTFDDLMIQIEHNEAIVNDFGVLKPKSREGIWNHHQIKLRNGAMLTGMPLMGAALGKRPHEIYFDDVEKSEDMVVSPSELIAQFQSFFFNVVYPMADNFEVAIRVVGTLLSRRTFIHWLHTTEDPRIDDWRRLFHAVVYVDKEGKEQDEWPEKMGREWQAVQKRRMGQAAFAAQYMNDPGTEAERVLQIHPELNTYWVEDEDDALVNDPLNSKALMVSHQLAGWDDSLKDRDAAPIPASIVRPFGETVQKMRRFIVVDWAKTISESSDFSCIHVMGIENSKDYRDTLWSLDLWLGKKPTEEVIRRAYLMALKWSVPLVAVEAYPVQMEFAERLKYDLPSMYGEGEVPCRVLHVKFPARYSKADKITGLHWRFRQFRLKLPSHLRRLPGYRELWYQIENFTEDLALLRHDDAIDTLATHLAIGKPSAPSGPDEHIVRDAITKLRDGEYVDPDSGISTMSGINASEIPNDVLEDMFQKRWEHLQEVEQLDWCNYQ